jgi:hypothetical protein
MYEYGSISPVPLGPDGQAVGAHRAHAALTEVDGPPGEVPTQSDGGCDLVRGAVGLRLAVSSGRFPAVGDRV